MVETKKIELIKNIILDFSTDQNSLKTLGLKELNFSMITLVPLDEYYEKFRLFLSAPNLDNYSIHEVYESFIPFLMKNLPDETYLLIWNIVFIKSSDELVLDINSLYQTNDKVIHLSNVNIGGNKFDNIIVAYSQDLVTI